MCTKKQQHNFVRLERNSGDIFELAVSLLKWVRHDLMKEQKNVRVYTPFGVQNLCSLSQLGSMCVFYIVSSFR